MAASHYSAICPHLPLYIQCTNEVCTTDLGLLCRYLFTILCHFSIALISIRTAKGRGYRQVHQMHTTLATVTESHWSNF